MDTSQSTIMDEDNPSSNISLQPLLKRRGSKNDEECGVSRKKQRGIVYSIDNVPSDMIFVILSFIPYSKKDWLKILLVNKRFHQIGKRVFDPSINNNYAIR